MSTFTERLKRRRHRKGALSQESSSAPGPVYNESVLAELIATGQADPISDEEQQIADRLRAFYEKKFGNKRV